MNKYSFLIFFVIFLLVGCQAKVTAPAGTQQIEQTSDQENEAAEEMPQVPEEWKGKTIKEIMNQSDASTTNETDDNETITAASLPEGTHIVEARKTETTMVFFPKESKIKVGETIRFVNNLDYLDKKADLTFYSYLSGVFRSPELKYGKYFEYTFNETGNFTYNALPYNNWFKKGTITVTR